ncbi:MAG: pyridoxamine 5'-phosphate oxidase family protein [Dethiobacteria bacterium]
MSILTDDIKDILRTNICYFATSSPDSKPNVVPVGLVEPISDHEVLLADVHFYKTKKNLEQNPQVAIAVTDLPKKLAFQLKGKAEIIPSGELYEKLKQILATRAAKKIVSLKKKSEKTDDPELRKIYRKRIERIENQKARTAVLVTINEIYSTL